MKRFPKADWVLLGQERLFCERCGNSYPLAMPIDLGVLEAAAEKAHLAELRLFLDGKADNPPRGAT